MGFSPRGPRLRGSCAFWMHHWEKEEEKEKEEKGNIIKKFVSLKGGLTKSITFAEGEVASAPWLSSGPKKSMDNDAPELDILGHFGTTRKTY